MSLAQAQWLAGWRGSTAVATTLLMELQIHAPLTGLRSSVAPGVVLAGAPAGTPACSQPHVASACE